MRTAIEVCLTSVPLNSVSTTCDIHGPIVIGNGGRCRKKQPQGAEMTFLSVPACMGCVELAKKAEPPPTRDVNRDSGTASANGSGDWLDGNIKSMLKVSYPNLMTSKVLARQK
jgi:hypothetical protein